MPDPGHAASVASPSVPRPRRPGAIAVAWLLVAGSVAGSGPGIAAAAPAPAWVGTGAARLEAAPSRPATPLLSVRRVAPWVETTAVQQRLGATLAPIMARLGKTEKSACLVVEQAGHLVAAIHPSTELEPASNMKLLTATAVLDRIGPTARITTQVTATRRPKGGVLHGNLYLIGHGDPFLRTPAYLNDLEEPEPEYTSLPALAAKVRAAGIRRIDGSVIGDEAYFDTQRAVPTWNASYIIDEDVGPLSALDVNDGFSLTKPQGTEAEPAVSAARVFTTLLKKDGVKVSGPPGRGVSPKSAVPVTSIESLTMGRIVDQVLTASDDTGAELLLKQLGARFGGAGSTSAGIAVERADLAKDGLPVSQLVAKDGSGLDTEDRVTCGLIADDLVHEGTSGVLFAGLPVAARTGTLVTRMAGTPAAGRLHAKTGTLDDVTALSGWVLPAKGQRAPTAALGAPVAFSLIINNIPSVSTGQMVEDAIGVRLATPMVVPPLAAAEPSG